MKTRDTAKLTIHGKTTHLPVVNGNENQLGIDISKLYRETGAYTYDSGFSNTAAGFSNITYIDGANGTLRMRGYNLHDLVKHCSFREVAYLMVHGTLPSKNELDLFSKYLTEHSLVHEDMHHFFAGFPSDSHPMAILASMVTSLSSFYPDLNQEDSNFDITAARLISKVRTIAAFSYKKSKGQPIVYPRYDLYYCENFLHMMFGSPVRKYEIDPLHTKILDKLLILHIDHGQNCSTSAVKLIGSARANLYAAISAGICALWGPLHGGANQAVIEMFKCIRKDNNDIQKYINMAKDKSNPFRLMGFGHAVYKNYDPRARLAKELLDELFQKRNITDPLLDTARRLEDAALKDPYFQERKLYPNIDFYSGILYRAIGIPTNMLTVMFALGRLPGWIAQWKEFCDNKGRIYRPRQIYTGPGERPFVPIDQR
ncbi:citrate synthase [Chitinivibrio alkaliphilus]|uniref:Citrate synthase n=1 Tax=Chitinivibrio alkaliphilus ACht1 TaxID=1313304 RepID=U7D9L3_9BACT|nr:citrate synthase [Chitinivibrio alkaliphilus]ERP31777.1 citrate synthase [Chitinivibrio alkaliphilus ACht1]